MQLAIQQPEGLLGNFSSKKKLDHSRSSEYMELGRLNLHLGHQPIPTATSQKLECVVCCIKQAKLHLTRRDLWHKSRIKCLHYGVHPLCNEEEERQCYTKYHTHIQYVIVVLCFSRRSYSRSPLRHKRSHRSPTTKTMYLHRPINIYYLYICIFIVCKICIATCSCTS